MKIIKIIRISTKKQATHGNSVQDQDEMLDKYAEKLDAEVIDTIKIQVSGSKMQINSGVLMIALEKARTLKASLMVAALDRLSRDASTLMMLRKNAIEKGVDVLVAGMERSISSMNTIEFGVLSSFCEYERQRIAQRTKNATKKRSNGFAFGKADPSQSARTSIEKRRKLANEWREQINLIGEIKNAIELLKAPTLERIAQMLNGKGLVTIRGKAWSKAHLSVQLKAMGLNRWQELA
jgi:DNA invertase Pin-like site-specific DNA recombinase